MRTLREVVVMCAARFACSRFPPLGQHAKFEASFERKCGVQLQPFNGLAFTPFLPKRGWWV